MLSHSFFRQVPSFFVVILKLLTKKPDTRPILFGEKVVNILGKKVSQSGEVSSVSYIS